MAQHPQTGLLAAAAVLVVACPRALGLAASLALSMALAQSSWGIVWVRIADHPADFIALFDGPNPTASAALQDLLATKITVALQSGGQISTTAAMEGELGITDGAGPWS